MTTRDDIHKIKQALECACQNNASNVTLLTDIEEVLLKLYDLTLSANWTSYIGNSIQYTYDANNNVTVAEFYEGVNLVYTQTFTYDANNNCTSIVVS
jgi:hypothetical protein